MDVAYQIKLRLINWRFDLCQEYKSHGINRLYCNFLG